MLVFIWNVLANLLVNDLVKFIGPQIKADKTTFAHSSFKVCHADIMFLYKFLAR